MKLTYYPDTDSLYIDLSHRPSVESRELSEGIVLDYDDAGQVVGIDIDNASVKVELHELMISKVSFTTQTITGSYVLGCQPLAGRVLCQGQGP